MKTKKRSFFAPLSVICIGMLFFGGSTIQAFASNDSQLPIGPDPMQIGVSSVAGQVIDATGLPVIGASVIVKGTTIGASTDVDGRFTINNIPSRENLSISVSFIGYITQEVRVTSSSPLTIVLQEDTQVLSDVVVIGYGTEKKKNVSGAVSNITSEELVRVPTENMQRALQGKVAGVQIISATGTPGGAVSVIVRGSGSISANNEPLYIIDGVQMITGDQSSGIIKSTDVLSTLNPSEIQSIDILKDGASASIYGAQAANGVVIITTKKGQEGKNKISVSLSGGVQQIANKIDILTGPQVVELDLIAHKNRYGENSTEYQNKLQEYRNNGWGEDGFSNTPTYDWYDLLYRTAYVGDVQVSLSGGSAKEKHYLSAAFNSTDGILIGTGFKRGTFRVNLSYELANWLTLTTNNSYSVMNQDQQSSVRASNPNRIAFLMHPANSPYDENGDYYTSLPYGYFMHNTVQMQDLNEYKGRTNKLLSANALDFKITKDLTFKSSYNIDIVSINEHLFVDPRTREGEKVQGSVTAFTKDLTNFQTEQVLNYSTLLDDIHRISAMGGFSYRHQYFQSHGGTGTGVSHPTLHLLGSTAIPTEVTEDFSEWKMAGVFARINYSYRDRYIVNATIRRDGSSRFGDENKWGWFPSVSAAWRINDEAFMKGLTVFDDLKLRASYGVTGNSDIGDYIARRWYSSGGAYNNTSAIIPASIGNPYLTWEKSHSKNIGLSLSILNSRISSEMDFYIKDTKELLYARTIPATTGFTQIPSNMGGVRNTGFEFLLNTVNIKNNDWEWNTSFNISYNKNEITSLQDGLTELGTYKVGESITSEPVYQWAGVNEADGRPMYYDKDGFIVYNPKTEDRVWSKPREPKFFGGLTNAISWKGFELSFFFQFQKGGVSLWSDKITLLASAGDSNTMLEKYTSYWKKPGDVTWVPKPSYEGAYPGNPRGNDQESTLHYEKTDYIKLKNIMLSYNFNKKLIQPLHIANLQIYASTYNLCTWTTYPGNDPEFTGYDTGVYPQSRTYNVGVKLDF